MGKRFTPKQERFVAEYIRTANASEAYRLAYKVGKMKPATINHNAFDLLQNPNIAQPFLIFKGWEL